MAICLQRGTLVTGRGIWKQGTVWMENGKFTRLERRIPERIPPETDVIRLPDGSQVFPGFIDLHIHGAAGADVMDAVPEALETIARALPAEGTTAFLATTMTGEPEAIERALENVARFVSAPGSAECLGVHLEGPFIHPDRAGAQPKRHILPPDPSLARRWQDLAGGRIRLVTLAPERPGGLELISCFRDLDVIVSIGHSDATWEVCDRAIAAGASHVTHLFNGMRGLHHREAGVAGAALLREELTVELIADGVHVSPPMAGLAYRLASARRLVLVTDAMRAKCMGDGVFELGGQRVRVVGNEARLEDGTLAGSVLTMCDAVANMRAFTGCDAEEAAWMTSGNPARILGMEHRKGSIEDGKDADLTVLGPDGRVSVTVCRGVVSYSR